MLGLILVLLCGQELVFFLLPGLAALLLISRKRSIASLFALPFVVVVGAAFGYAAFWLYFANKTAGQVFSYALIAAAVAVLIGRRRDFNSHAWQPDFYVPLCYVFCLAVLSLSLLYLWVDPVQAGVDVANFRFFPEIRPGDNIIPFIFAQRIYDRAPVRPFCCGDWLSSDRPPLQAGIFLLQRPLRVLGNTGLQYQVLGTLLQCLWICGVWTLLRAMGATRSLATQTLGLLLFSAFLFYNEVYVWPKLLAACFVLFVFAIIGPAALERRGLTTFEALLAATSFVSALLAHPGTIFSAPAILLILLFRRQIFTWKQAGWACAIALIGIVPWTMYQKLYDPPGNRLLKMHLAGVGEPDSRGVLETIEHSYAQLSTKQILENKAENLRSLFWSPWRGLRVEEREYIVFALWLLIIAALTALAARTRAMLPHTGAVFSVAAFNLLMWCLILFGPGQTETPHASYADILLVAIGLISVMLASPTWARTALICIQIADLVFVWVLYRPASFVLPTRAIAPSSLQWPMLVLAAIFGGGLLLAAAFPDALFKKKAE